MPILASRVLGHLLVVYVLAAPWLARLRRTRAPQDAPPDIHVARMRLYQRVVMQQAVIGSSSSRAAPRCCPNRPPNGGGS